MLMIVWMWTSVFEVWSVSRLLIRIYQCYCLAVLNEVCVDGKELSKFLCDWIGNLKVELSVYGVRHLHTKCQPVITGTAFTPVLLSASEMLFNVCVLWAECCHCMSGTSMVRIVYSACLSVNRFCVNSLRWLARLFVCSLISTIPSFRSVYVSLWFAFPLQFIIKGDFDKCAGGFYKPHWPQRKSCPLTGAGHTCLYWLSCCQGYLTELWVSFITAKLLKPCFFLKFI